MDAAKPTTKSLIKAPLFQFPFGRNIKLLYSLGGDSVSRREKNKEGIRKISGGF